ncbi:hypothetical protein CFE70_002816 [Pyrenophora teres f. teres 0-1]
MPDIKEFCGEATDDYERWRRETAVDKCASLPDETYRIAYLKQKISAYGRSKAKPSPPRNAMDTVPNDNETLSEFLRRARSIDEASQDIYAGKATATATSSATKTRRHALGD